MGSSSKGRRQVHLELDDGWLSEAAVVAAQHESDKSERRRLLADPAAFLIEKGWNGLANATAEELRSAVVATSRDATPVEDDAVRTGPTRISPGHEWNRPKPRTSERTSTSVLVDLVKLERANRSHHLLEKILAEKIRDRGYEPMSNNNIDIYFRTPDICVLAEIKSCGSKNIHSQVRKGISQLLEYRYLYRGDLGDAPILALLLETSLPVAKAWLLDYLRSLEISLVWKHPNENELVSIEPIPEALAGIVRPQGAN